MNFLKKLVIKDIQETKLFTYKRGKVSLQFSLRIDIKQELKDFKECLKSAIEDIEEELNKQ